MPEKPRYKKATQTALELSSEFNIQTYPVDIKTIIKKKGIRLKKYSTLAKYKRCSVDKIGDILQTQHGILVRHSPNDYTLNYNDTLPDYVIRFTLAHELGHYCLQHLEDFELTEVKYKGLSETEYQLLEREANCFARNLLSPEPIASLFTEKNEHDLMEYFGIGYEAACTRIDFLGNDSYYSKNGIPMATYKYFKQSRKRAKYTYHCEKCEAITIGKNTAYCSICKHETLIHVTQNGYCLHKDFGGEILKYRAIPIDQDGYAYECPICENEVFEENAKLCHICGNSRFNVCLGHIHEFENIYGDKYHVMDLESNGCGTKLPGNARYCYKCGGTSSFYYQNILPPWNVEYNTLKESEYF